MKGHSAMNDPHGWHILGQLLLWGMGAGAGATLLGVSWREWRATRRRAGLRRHRQGTPPQAPAPGSQSPGSRTAPRSASLTPGRR